MRNTDCGFQLLTVVEVPKEKRVRCQYKDCQHPIYKQIHIVRFASGAISCIGSKCYSLLKESQASTAVTAPLLGDRSSVRLTEEEISLLASNTEELIKRFSSAPEAEEIKNCRVGSSQLRNDKALKARALELTRQKFLTKGIDPDLPGWKGWFERETKELYEQLKYASD
ncbi:hypothetical protein ACQKFE_08105 [Stutzerimonas stutzeri]|uniref:hypothetical protein n=1 Tax=Stutzerimonas stutzeri TaxID=316 RepID=UPI003D0396CF